MQLPITIGLHRSHLLDRFVFLSALLASLVVIAFPQAMVIQGAVLLAVWCCSAHAWRRLSPQCSAIRLERTGHLSVALADMEEFSMAEFMAGAIVHPWLTVVRLETDGGRMCTLIATVDNVDREDFRRLRVFLRWQADFSVPDDDA
ncbi:MAG TPA: protein YgfX [Azonexus sp.]|nr:protein YgfX [Azonexus sp.]